MPKMLILKGEEKNGLGREQKRKKQAVYLAAAFASFFKIASLAIV